jgi:Mn2+/Fe2+ NRAMP family transporter
MKNGLIDARVGACLMAIITLMIMSTAAALFHGSLTADQIRTMNAVDVANQLEPAFGEMGRVLFCIGLFSAAYSSFLVNSMIGGFILADGLGLGDTPNDRWPRLFTAAVLLVGMVVGMYVIQTGQNPVRAIVAAQAVTVLAAPLIGGTLWWLTSRRDVMGEYRNSPLMNLAAAIGFALLLGMAYRLAAVEIPKNFKALTAAPAAVAPSTEAPDQE